MDIAAGHISSFLTYKK